MRRFNPSDSRAMVAATCLLALGTGVRIALAPDAADVTWQPAQADRAAETIGQIRVQVDRALRREVEASRPLEPGERIDINTADESALRRLPGVGPSRAAAIGRERSVGGPFRSPSDLTRIPGIGEGLAERLAPHLDFESGADFSPQRPAPGRLDLNRAQINELEQITGIGPALAARIARIRGRRGGFDTLEDLLEVSGIGPKTLETLRDEAYVR